MNPSLFTKITESKSKSEQIDLSEVHHIREEALFFNYDRWRSWAKSKKFQKLTS